MFHITNGKGFQITFSNNITVSVQFSEGHYCHNRFKKDKKPRNGIYDSISAEVAVIDEESGEFITDIVMNETGIRTHNYASPETVAKIINEVSKMKSYKKGEPIILKVNEK